MVSKSNIYTVEELVKSGVLYKPLDGNHGGIHPKGSDFVESGIPFIMASDMLNGQIDTRNCKFISSEQASTLRKGFAITGDVLLSHKATIGRTAIVGDIDSDFIVLTPQVTYYRIKDSKKLDNRYLKYYFDSHQFQSILNQWAGGGSTRAYLGITAQLKLPINVIDISDQKAIAHILGTLDDKIELNRQMNETLEVMAQALFKSWFVDFDPVIDNALLTGKAIPEPLKERAELRHAQLDSGKANTNSEINDLFPSEFEFTEELGWIPKGWSVCYFKNIVEKYIDNRGKTPPLSESGIPLIEVKHISDNSLKPSLDTSKYVDRETYNTWFRAHLETDDIIISTVGTIGRICIVSEGDEFCIAQNLLGFRFNQEKALPSFMYYQMDSNIFRHDVNARLVTTVQSSIKRKDLETIPLLISDIHIQEEFNKTVAPLMEKQNLNSNINLSLANLRDTLLPKLMSGELRIPDAEKLAENI